MRLTRATPKAVRYACLHFHYAKSVPSVSYGFNVYNDGGEWCGVVCFGCGAAHSIGAPFGLPQGEIVELVRVALNGKQPTTSECVSAALRELHRVDPLVRMVVSYADVDQGHVGTIYQATNWLYLGKVKEGNRSAFVINGRKVHPRTIGSAGCPQTIEAVRKRYDPNAEEFKTAGKHKYVYCFDRKLRKRLTRESKPYPKRDGQESVA